MRLLLLISVSLSVFLGKSQGAFAPAAGEIGTTAIHKDSSLFVGWANQVVLDRGYKDILDPSQGFVSFGFDDDGVGEADGQAVSLGDSGVAVITFLSGIADEPGPDFAVFENAFNPTFLELAYVEVSSDGINYFRFPSSFTLDTTQIGSFGSSDPTHIHNLAGKYQVNYGTPFDLADISNDPLLDKSFISHVRIIDVVGNVNLEHTDSEGRVINDPYPTAFDQGGFDLDAVGVIHFSSQQTSLSENKEDRIQIYPNPATNYIHIKASSFESYELVSISGEILLRGNTEEIKLQNVPKGIYFLKVKIDNELFTKRVIKN